MQWEMVVASAFFVEMNLACLEPLQPIVMTARSLFVQNVVWIPVTARRPHFGYVSFAVKVERYGRGLELGFLKVSQNIQRLSKGCTIQASSLPVPKIEWRIRDHVKDQFAVTTHGVEVEVAAIETSVERRVLTKMLPVALKMRSALVNALQKASGVTQKVTMSALEAHIAVVYLQMITGQAISVIILLEIN